MKNIFLFFPPTRGKIGAMVLPGLPEFQWYYITQVISGLWAVAFAWPDPKDETMAGFSLEGRACLPFIYEMNVPCKKIYGLITADLARFANVTMGELKDGKPANYYLRMEDFREKSQIGDGIWEIQINGRVYGILETGGLIKKVTKL